MRLDAVVYRSGRPWAAPWEEAFAAGLRRHGIGPEERPQAEIRASDLAVIWAHRQRPLFDAQRAAGGRYIVMERGYMGDREAWTSLGYDGLNGRADFCLDGDPGPERWQRHFDGLMRPWRARPGPVVVMGQVPGDASIRDVDIAAWAREVCDELRAAGEEVWFRPHPLARGGAEPVGVACQRGPLAEALAAASRVVTYNSNAGVDAVLAGVPAVVMDRGGMAWDVAGRAPEETVRPDRTAWAHRMAWCQWSLAEIARGEAWAHLRRGVGA